MMTQQDLNAAALRRYRDRFDNAGYNRIAEFISSNLNADRDDERVLALLAALQHAAFGLCGHSDHADDWHALAVRCGRNFLSQHTVDAMRDFLRGFAPDDARIDDFECTAKGMLRAWFAREDLQTATDHASGIPSWRGRMASDLLAAADELTHAAIRLLAHEDDGDIREKLRRGLNRITGALYTGIRHSDRPALYTFRSTYFPDEGDR
jgi:hypothetical protein